MMTHSTAKRLLSSLLRPLALALPVLACAIALSGCDDGDAPQPADGEAWIVEQLAAVQDLTQEEQAQHFASVADELEIAHSHLKRPGAPKLDFTSSDEAPESELAPAPECVYDSGCIAWDSTNGCILAQSCYVCSATDWNCIIISGNGY